MKRLYKLLVTDFIFLFIFMMSMISVTHLTAKEKAEKNTAGELVVEDATGEKIMEDETAVKKKKKAESYLIQVTAQKRKQNIQDIPGSVSAFNVKQIKDAGISKTDDIEAYVPNMSSFAFSDSFSFYSIRGQNNANNNSNSVGIYVDDVPSCLSSNLTDSHLWNLERIEVLRGPQGNLYGLNSSGGVVNIITQKPDNYWTGGASASYGSYNTHKSNAAISGPIIKDNLYFGVSGIYKGHDSYVKEEGHDDRATAFAGGRGQLRWTPLKNLDMLFTAESGRSDANYNTFTLADDDPYTVEDHNFDECNDMYYHNQSLWLKISLPFCDIVSVSGHGISNQKFDMDYFSAGTMYFESEQNTQRFIQELRVSSNDEKSALKWLAGGFFLSGNMDCDSKDVMVGMGESNTDCGIKQRTFSSFGPVSYTHLRAHET